MAGRPHKFQAPKGTRDFYPADMAVRRHIESAWRAVSIRHGFEEVDGPTFEHLELYTVKSGPGIVSELFSFRRAGGETDYALRPEFTPTLARMVAARGAQLPKPIRWFSVPTMFRAERPQRGRLREHVQWNVDILGDASPHADAEVIAVAVEALGALGLRDRDVAVRFSDRRVVQQILEASMREMEQMQAVLELLDRRTKLREYEFRQQAEALSFYPDIFDEHARVLQATFEQREATGAEIPGLAGGEEIAVDAGPIEALRAELESIGVLDWCTLDLNIVRGLAYYTGTVFEIHEVTGRERAIAGGGRYDDLVELLGGPPVPAVGIAMGDVVLRLVLEDQGALEPAEEYLPRPDVFVISAGKDAADAALPGLVADLRRAGLHVRTSARSTRNVGKLLGEAGKVRARVAVILGDELQAGRVVVKDLDSEEQTEVPLDGLHERLRASGDGEAAG